MKPPTDALIVHVDARLVRYAPGCLIHAVLGCLKHDEAAAMKARGVEFFHIEKLAAAFTLESVQVLQVVSADMIDLGRLLSENERSKQVFSAELGAVLERVFGDREVVFVVSHTLEMELVNDAWKADKAALGKWLVFGTLETGPSGLDREYGQGQGHHEHIDDGGPDRPRAHSCGPLRCWCRRGLGEDRDARDPGREARPRPEAEARHEGSDADADVEGVQSREPVGAEGDPATDVRAGEEVGDTMSARERADDRAALSWFRGFDTGVSSLTIWSVMTGHPVQNTGIPYDPADFGRCYRLLELFPEWKTRLGEVSARYPEWRPFVEAWPRLTAMYEKALETRTAGAPAMYVFMKTLRPVRR